MNENENKPSYESLEDRLEALNELALLCVRIFDGCVDAYVSGRDISMESDEPPMQPENVAIVHRMNTQVDSIHVSLLAIKESGLALECGIPNRITGKTVATKDQSRAHEGEIANALI